MECVGEVDRDNASRLVFFFQAEDGIRDVAVTGVQTCALPIFCYLRPGTVLGPRTKAGAFVEIKKSTIGQDTKVPHLSYIGDAEIGEGSNIGAGSITANFPHRPGQPKGKTSIGSNVRVAVDTMFVAPVTVGDDAWTAAGAVITDDVPDNALAGFPPRQVNKEGRGGKRND